MKDIAWGAATGLIIGTGIQSINGLGQQLVFAVLVGVTVPIIRKIIG